jgi:hydroxymethylglutaryl-CoA reductase (NADPH)
MSQTDPLLGEDIPRDRQDDFAAEAVQRRQDFVRQKTETDLAHLSQPSFDPHLATGNIEQFLGVAQVPIGLAGPLLVNGQHAQGDFYVPLATTEGTLVASYNRGMKVLRACGGVMCTVVGDQMQRAPVFVLDNAREGRRFVDWVVERLPDIRLVAEATSSVARLKHIEYVLSHRFAYLRFNFTTGDAAGQNMVGRATYAACEWITENYRAGKIERFFLESNFATDKKASMVNMMRTRGKRVTAEATIKREALLGFMGVDSLDLVYHHGVSNVGSFMAGVNNNGLHSANAVTALFIATGQDVANVAESSAAVIYAELTEDKDLYLSITLPSLIVATRGGGTGLPTQRECLQILGCQGDGKVFKLAEIVAATVLAGELSLACAISSRDWVSSHERMGRHRT